MTLPEVVTITPRFEKQPRAVRVPEEPTWDDFHEVLCEFCFEWYGDRMGVYRLYVTASEDAEDEINSEDLKRVKESGAPLLLRDRHACVQPVYPGNWLVEPNDGDVDGFEVMTDDQFTAAYKVVPSAAEATS